MTDSTDIALPTPAQPPAAATQGTLLQAITELARDGEIRRDILELLMDRQERAEARQAERAFNAAMTAAQAEIDPVARTAKNTATNSKYAKLEAVDAAIRPIYIRHGFSVSYSQEPGQNGNVSVICYVSHVGGHTKRYAMEAPPDTLGPKGTPVKTALHGLGSTTTFLRRYLVCGAFNVVLADEDDDGQRGGAKWITTEQIAELEDLIRATETDAAAMLAAEAPKAADLADIQQHDFARIKGRLIAKKMRMETAPGTKLDGLENAIAGSKKAPTTPGASTPGASADGAPAHGSGTAAPSAGADDPVVAKRRKWAQDRAADIATLDHAGLARLGRGPGPLGASLSERRDVLLQESPHIDKIIADAIVKRTQELGPPKE